MTKKKATKKPAPKATRNAATERKVEDALAKIREDNKRNQGEDYAGDND